MEQVLAVGQMSVLQPAELMQAMVLELKSALRLKQP
jgi:hypothetical protein